MPLITLKGVLFILLIGFMYAFTIVLSFVVVGVISEKMKLNRKMPPKRLNLFIYTIAATIWLGFAFLWLNDWAAFMWKEYVVD